MRAVTRCIRPRAGLPASSGTESTPIQKLNWRARVHGAKFGNIGSQAVPRLREDPMTQGSYKQFCPVAMTAEILCTRWTVVLLRELMRGSTRFNDLRRGLPRMSPALLSQRLKDLEDAGVLTRKKSRAEPSVLEYHLTKAGRELEPIVEAFGIWGQRWVDKDVSLQNLGKITRLLPSLYGRDIQLGEIGWMFGQRVGRRRPSPNILPYIP